ncbi:AAA-ATPase At3g50940-like [Solanum pennellii]|nr:AAA-ATPase At3g50940-like [Solanum pennellii]
MDVHIHMAYCTPCGFKLLANNYLGIKDHKLFKEIEELIDTANVTPAEVAEQLLKEDEAEDSLRGLVNFIHKKIKEKEEAEAEAEAKPEKVEIPQVEVGMTMEGGELDAGQTHMNLQRLPRPALPRIA